MLRRLRGICPAGGRRQKAERRGRGSDPELRFFPAQNVPDPAFHTRLPKGRGPGHGQTGACREAEQGSAVGLRGAALRCQHLFIAAHFHILVHQGEGEPDQGIEPVNREQQKRECLDQMIPTPQVIPLMGQDIAQRLFLQAQRQIDPRPDQPKNKRGADAVRFIDPILGFIVWYAHRPGQSPLHPKITDRAPEQQYPHAGAPQPQSRRDPDPCRIRARGAFRRREQSVEGFLELGRCGASLDLCRLVESGWNVAHTPGLPGALDSGRTNRGDAKNAEHAGKAHRTTEPKAHDAPQEIGPLFRRAAQQKPKRQHRGNDDRPGEAHIQHPQKNLVHFSPPYARR